MPHNFGHNSAKVTWLLPMSRILDCFDYAGAVKHIRIKNADAS